MKWFLLCLGVAIFLTVGCGPGKMVSEAQAHGPYLGRNDPVTNNGCCGGSDCAPVPLDADWVQPVSGGYQVTLTLAQAQTINSHSQEPIDTFVPEARVMVIGTVAEPYTGPIAFYHICLVADKLRCLFVTPST